MYKRWTAEETAILADAVKECPTVKAACIVASTKTGRSLAACQYHWFDYCKKQKQVASKEEPKSLWQKILGCFFN